MQNTLRKVLAVLLAFLLASTNIFAVSAQFNDTNNHWAKQQITRWQEKGILSGTSKTEFKPNDPLTKAQLVMILSKVFNYVQTSDKNFSDVKDGAWYADAVSKAVAAGIIDAAASAFMPEAAISRQEAVIIMQKAFRLEVKDTELLSNFTDADQLTAEGAQAFGAMVEKKYIAGKPGKRLAPDDKLTRAEAVTIIDKLVSELADQPGEYTGKVAGNVVVNTPDVVLKDMTIKGNLYLAQGIGEGDVTLDNVKVLGDTLVEGGGENSILLNNTSLEGSMIVIKLDGKVRILAQGATSVQSININSGVLLQEAASCIGGFGNVQIMNILPGQSIQLDGDFETITVKGEDAKIDILNGSVKSINVDKKSNNTVIKVDDKAVVSQITANSNLEVSGKGKIEKATVKANGVSFDNKPESLELGDKINVMVENQEIDNSKLTTLYPPAIPPVFPTPSAPSITVSVSTEPVILSIGQTVTGPAITCTPADAAISYASDNSSVATVDPVSGEITGVNYGWAYITATATKAGYTSGSARYRVVIPSQSDAGVFYVNPAQIRKNTTQHISLTYVPPQSSLGDDGQIEFDLPAEFPVADNSFTAHSSGGMFDATTSVKILNDGRKVQVKNYSKEYSTFMLSYEAKAPDVESEYTFSATWDEDGDDIVKTPSQTSDKILTIVKTIADLSAPYDMCTKDSVTLKWTPVSDAVSIEVWYKTNNTSWGKVADPVIDMVGGSVRVAELEEDTNYQFYIKVIGGDSEGESNMVGAVTLDETPVEFDDSYPSILSVAETNVKIAVKANDRNYSCYAVTIKNSELTANNEPKNPKDVMDWPYEEQGTHGIFQRNYFYDTGEHVITIEGLEMNTSYTTFMVAYDYSNEPTSIKEVQFTTLHKVTRGEMAHFLATNYAFDWVVNPNAAMTDIAGHQYENDIMELLWAGIVNGVAEGRFAPNGDLTKAEFAALLTKTKEYFCGPLSNDKKTLPVEVKDVGESWAKPFIAVMVNLGIFIPDGSGKIYPNQTLTSDYLSAQTIERLNQSITHEVTRGEVAHFLALKYDFNRVVNPSAVVTDIAGHEYQNSIMKLLRAEIMKGTTEGTFVPDGSLTKEEFAVILTRLKAYFDYPNPLSEDLKNLPASVKDANEIDVWCKDSVAVMVNLGIFIPDGSGKVYPKQNLTSEYLSAQTIVRLNQSITHEVTRGEVAHFLATNYDFDRVVNPNAAVTDIAGYVYAADIMELLRAGIVNGTQEGTFVPDGGMTKEEFSVVLTRVKEYFDGPLSAELKILPASVEDVDEISAWAKDFVAVMVNLGIFIPDGSGKVYPKQNLTSDYLTAQTIALLNK